MLFDEHADAIFDSIDVMAERVRRVGGTTIRSISHIGQLQTIEDDNSSVVSAGEMIRILMEDNGHIAKMGAEAMKYCVGNVSKIFEVDRLCSSNNVPVANKGLLLHCTAAARERA
ncbi:MAG TPA: hypothetical protein VEH06_00535 [Candidatus Bathyarchaeia archaeon]|nr:hypothetical protein [Candidatus Bathyarchaeia archaeon]